MDAASISVKTEQGTVRVDAPMRSINRGSHSRVHKLYQKLGIRLRRLDFGYTFTRLEDSPAAGATVTDDPPAYNAEDEKVSQPFHTATATHQSTQLLYEGSSGLRWPPLAIPSHLQPSFARPSPLPLLLHIAHLSLLAFSYLHLLLLSFFYVSAGLTDVRPSSSWPARCARRLGLREMGSEPLRAWCLRRRVWKEMVDEVLVPLWAAVTTVDRTTAEGMPVGEVLRKFAAACLLS